MITVCWVCLVILFCGVFSQENLPERTELEEKKSSGIMGWVEDSAMRFLDSILPDNNSVEGRKKKKKSKYVLPLVIGFLLIKSILLPIALKSLAVLSGKAVILSLMSLILAAIVGLKKVAQGPASSNYDVVNIPISKYRRTDDYYRRGDVNEDMPYQYYRD